MAMKDWKCKSCGHLPYRHNQIGFAQGRCRATSCSHIPPACKGYVPVDPKRTWV